MSIRGVNVGGNLFDITDSSNVAPIELTNFATRNYAKDRCFIMIDGLLYRAMVAISSGDPIVINGNAKRTTLDEMFSVVETDSDLIAPTEDGATSSDDYAIGAQIVRSGILYEVIDNITEGDAFVVGNNIELAGSVSEQLTSLKSHLTNVEDVINNNGAKNLLPNTATSQVINGITFEVNPTGYPEGCIKVNGTATAIAELVVFPMDYLSFTGACHLSGCPQGGYEGGVAKYALSIQPYIAPTRNDFGNGADVTITNDDKYRVKIVIYNGVTVSDLIFKPMITLASQPHSDYAHYVPYAKTNRELTENTPTIPRFTESAGTVISAAGQSYTAPRNGCITAIIKSDSASQNQATIRVNNVSVIRSYEAKVMQVFPIKKGDVISTQGSGTFEVYFSN